MTRIVGGTLGGRRLVTPPGSSTRPTAEKVRAALANSLQATGGLDGARVLDLYAGSGALGLELLSRGASTGVFVERDRVALTALRSNAALAKQGVTVVAADVLAYLGTAGIGPFDVVVADPPYDLPGNELVTVLSRLTSAGALAAHADVIVERGVKAHAPEWPTPLTGVRVRRYGDTLLCYGRAP